jgi:hypothetical protein
MNNDYGKSKILDEIRIQKLTILTPFGEGYVAGLEQAIALLELEPPKEETKPPYSVYGFNSDNDKL